MTLSHESLEDLRKKAEAAAEEFSKWTVDAPRWNNGRLHPAVAVALLDRIATLERLLAERGHADPP